MKPQNKQILDKIAILNGNGDTQEKTNKSDFDSHLTDFTTLKNKFICGSGVFNGTTGTVINHLANTTDYIIQITISSADITGAVGVYWCENKATTSFTVKNTGDSNYKFDWLLIKN